MGQADSKHNSEQGSEADVSDLQHGFDQENILQDENYGEIRLLKGSDNGGKQYAQKTKHCTNADEYNLFQKQIRKFKGFEHPNLIRVGEIRSQQDDGFCGNVYLVQTVLDYYKVSLKQHILERAKQSLYFTQEEIVQQLTQILDALTFLHSKAIYHGNITMKSILCSQEEGLKIGIPQIMNQHNHYQRILISQERECFLAPELFESVGKNNLSPQFDTQKADIFSVGVVALQICLLEETDSIYNFKDHSINSENVKSKLGQIAGRYSEKLAENISALLWENDVDRADFGQALLLFSGMGGQVSPQKYNNNTIASPEKRVQIQFQNSQEKSDFKHEDHSSFSHNSKHLVQSHITPERQDNYYQKSQHSGSPQRLVSANKSNPNFSETSNRYSRKDELGVSLQHIDQIYKQAVEQSNETKHRFESSQQLRGFLRELLEDEVFVPLQGNSNKKNKKSQKSVGGGVGLGKNQRWKV